MEILAHTRYTRRLSLITTTAVALITFLLLMTHQYVSGFHQFEEELKTQAAIIATNSAAALAFNDVKAAYENLGAIRKTARILGAAMYQADGTLSTLIDDPELAPMFERLGRNIRRHKLPVALLGDLLDAFSQDVRKTRYADFAELADYCRRSANPVGRLLLRLYKADTPANLELSDKICTALQLINFWQDVEVDWRKYRIYIPLADMERFGVTEAVIAAGEVTPQFSALMDFEIQRARTMMLQGAPLARKLPGRIGWELRLVVQGGLAILDKIEGVGYDVFTRRPTLGKTDWLRLAWRAATR